MFKRFQLFDLYFGKEKTTIGEWKNPEIELPKESQGVFRVKLNDSSEIDAYFMSDRCARLCSYSGTESSYWWHRIEKKPLYGVIQWATKKKTD